ncbi:MAG: hypothetical protein KJ921_13545, partial [Proteobacteria bacterium]|nr:hypothetical protein [Pseudomonadota bacterium]
WAKIELLTDSSEHMVQERFIPLVEHQLAEIVIAFAGERSPPSSQLLLHYAAGWDEATAKVPVILIHGAGLTASHCFADHPIEQPHEGLAARLARQESREPEEEAPKPERKVWDLRERLKRMPVLSQRLTKGLGSGSR